LTIDIFINTINVSVSGAMGTFNFSETTNSSTQNSIVGKKEIDFMEQKVKSDIFYQNQNILQF